MRAAISAPASGWVRMIAISFSVGDEGLRRIASGNGDLADVVEHRGQAQAADALGGPAQLQRDARAPRG